MSALVAVRRPWRAGAGLALAAALATLVATAAAADPQSRISRSVGVQGPAAAPGSALQEAPLEFAEPLRTGASRSQPSPPAELAARRAIAAVPLFRFAGVEAFLSGDEDRDGFHHRFRVSFDADVDHGEALVFARLYLSLAGGPWNRFHTTEAFVIRGDSDVDDYQVYTELDSGYPSGHYDLLIELYLVGDPHLVASVGPDQRRALLALPLESASREYGRDDYYDDDHHYGGHYGAGSVGVPGLIALTALLRRRLRGSGTRPGSRPAR